MTALASPKEKECGGMVFLLQKLGIQPWGGALVVQTHYQQHLSLLQPRALSFNVQQSLVTCHNPAGKWHQAWGQLTAGPTSINCSPQSTIPIIEE